MQINIFRPFRSRGPFHSEQFPQTLLADVKRMKLIGGSVVVKFAAIFITHLKSSYEVRAYHDMRAM